MRIKNKALIDYKRKYQNTWVAKNPVTDEAIASDKDLAKLAEKMKKMGVDYTLEKVLPLYSAFVSNVAL